MRISTTFGFFWSLFFLELPHNKRKSPFPLSDCKTQFLNQVAPIWNKLPENVVSSPTLNSLKSSLVQIYKRFGCFSIKWDCLFTNIAATPLNKTKLNLRKKKSSFFQFFTFYLSYFNWSFWFKTETRSGLCS